MLTTLKISLHSRPMLAVLYGVTLALGLLVALPMFSTLKAEDGDSLAPLQMLSGFDYTVYSDFMAQSDKAISPLLRVGRWAGLAYLLVSVFFAGGILYRFSQPGPAFRMVDFWRASSTYFRRFLGLLGVTALFVFSAGFIWLVVGVLVIAGLEDTLTERGLFWIGAFFFGLFALAATLVLCISDYAKVVMFRDDETNPFRAFGRAARLVRRNPRATFGRYWLLIALGTGLFGFYFLLDELIGMTNWPTIIIMVIVQQVFILSRIVLKVWNLGVVYSTYSKGNLVIRQLGEPGVGPPYSTNQPIAQSTNELNTPSDSNPDSERGASMHPMI